MSHVEGMGEKLRAEMLQNISGACEEWLLNPLGEKQGYNMARALLDACAAQVFQRKWADQVRSSLHHCTTCKNL
jgi:ferredoxin-like protein FixX